MSARSPQASRSSAAGARRPHEPDVWTVGADGVDVRLDKFLADPLRLGSRGHAVRALERGKVVVNEADVTRGDAGRRLSAGDRVRIWIDRPGSARRRAAGAARPEAPQILYDDDAVIVVNKPPGLLTVPLASRREAPSVHAYLVEYLRSRGKRRPLVVHRIDRDTSGLVVFTTGAGAQQRLKEQFKRHEPERVYLAVVYGRPSPPAGTWRDRLVWDRESLTQKETHARDPHGKEARCDYRVLEAFRDASLIEVRLTTGKRHQIRLQARLHGHPLVGERQYLHGPGVLASIAFPRQALHASRLAFVHPRSGERLRFEVPLPPDLSELLRTLRLQ